MFGMYDLSGMNNMSRFGDISGVHTVVIKGCIIRVSIGARARAQRICVLVLCIMLPSRTSSLPVRLSICSLKWFPKMCVFIRAMLIRME